MTINGDALSRNLRFYTQQSATSGRLTTSSLTTAQVTTDSLTASQTITTSYNNAITTSLAPTGYEVTTSSEEFISPAISFHVSLVSLIVLIFA